MTLFADLYIPFPSPSPPLHPTASSSSSTHKPNNPKGKQKASTTTEKGQGNGSGGGNGNGNGIGGPGGGGGSVGGVGSCWDGIGREEREGVLGWIGGVGYMGYQIIALTTHPSKPGQIPPNPFINSPPLPDLDPRLAGEQGGGGGRGGRGGMKLMQLSRLHIMLDDSNIHGLTNANTPLLSTYDLLSVQPLTPEAFSKACTDLTRPGPNQVSIITITVPSGGGPGGGGGGGRGGTRGLKRSLVKTALRNGAVFEILYSPSLSPSSTSSTSTEESHRARQSFFTTAREALRIIMAVSGGGGRDGVGRRGKGGGGVIFSSGARGGGEAGWEGVRGAGDLINLAVLLGMPANQAKQAVADTPQAVIVRAQARRTYKGVLSVPRIVHPNITPANPPTSVDEVAEVGREQNEALTDVENGDLTGKVEEKRVAGEKRKSTGGGGEAGGQGKKKLKVK